MEIVSIVRWTGRIFASETLFVNRRVYERFWRHFEIPLKLGLLKSLPDPTGHTLEEVLWKLDISQLFVQSFVGLFIN
jgi:hypothetical protein